MTSFPNMRGFDYSPENDETKSATRARPVYLFWARVPCFLNRGTADRPDIVPLAVHTGLSLYQGAELVCEYGTEYDDAIHDAKEWSRFRGVAAVICPPTPTDSETAVSAGWYTDREFARETVEVFRVFEDGELFDRFPTESEAWECAYRHAAETGSIVVVE